MRISISMPDALLKEAKTAAKDLGVSRGKVMQIALEGFLKRRRDEAITESINRYIAEYGNELSAEDEAWLEHGRQTVWRELQHDDWGPDGTEPTRK